MRPFLAVPLAALLLPVALLAQSPPNDEIAGAIVAAPGVNPGGSANFFTNVGASTTPGFQYPGCPGVHSDVWFAYVPSAVGPHSFATCVPAGYEPGSLQSSRLTVVDAGTLLPLACDVVGCGVQSPSDSGNQVKVSLYVGSLAPLLIRVASATGSTPGTFYFSVFSGTTTGGDSCATAASIGDGEHYGTWFNDVPSGILYGFPCSIPSISDDRWFSYAATATGVAHAVLERMGFVSTNLAAYSGSCAAATVLGCSVDQPNQVIFPVVAGSTYLLRAARTTPGPSPPDSEFVLSIRTVAPATNETCATPTTLVPGTNFAFTGTSLSEGGPSTGCGSVFDDGGQPDVWFHYSPPVASRVEVRLHGGGAPTGVLYSGACAGSPVLACGDPLVVYAAAGATLRLRAGARNFIGRGPMSVELLVEPTPANDLCASATTLTLGSNGPFPTAGAATDGAAPCAASAQDVWFQFAAPQDGVLRIDACGSVGDHVLSAQPACGAPAIACDDDDAAGLAPCASPDVAYLQFPVLAGQTYRVRAATASGTAGDLVLNVSYRLRQIVAWTGPTTVSLSNDAGTPGALIVNALTTTPTGFPNGYFFGIGIPFGELLLEIGSGPPFLAALGPTGAYAFAVGGLSPPLGLTLYGVAVTLGPTGAPLDVSVPASFAL